jgi:hypothetical protein
MYDMYYPGTIVINLRHPFLIKRLRERERQRHYSPLSFPLKVRRYAPGIDRVILGDYKRNDLCNEEKTAGESYRGTHGSSIWVSAPSKLFNLPLFIIPLL